MRVGVTVFLWLHGNSLPFFFFFFISLCSLPRLLPNTTGISECPTAVTDRAGMTPSRNRHNRLRQLFTWIALMSCTVYVHPQLWRLPLQGVLKLRLYLKQPELDCQVCEFFKQRPNDIVLCALCKTEMA